MLYRISLWAKQHQTAAQIAIIVLYCTAVLMVINLGKVLAAQGITISEWITFLVAGVIAVAFYAYPVVRQDDKRNKQKRLRLQTVLLFAGLLGYTLIACQMATPVPAATNSLSQVTPATETYGQFVVNKKKAARHDRKTARQERKSIRKRVRAEIRQWIRADRPAEGMSQGGAILLTILSVAGILFLGTLVLALSCSIACNGAAGVAAFALIAGLGGVLYLGFLTIRGIWRKRKVTKAAFG